MQIRKVRFLQNVKDSDNTVCSLFVRDVTSELLCLCNAYSANERNIIERIIQSGFAFYTVSQKTEHAYYVSSLFEKSNSIIDI